MTDAAWKRAERQAAKVLGGRRVPLSGGLPPASGLPASDVMGVEAFGAVEVRHRRTWEVRAWVREMERRARTAAWLLVLSTPGQRGRYAVLPLERLAALLRGDARSVDAVSTRRP